MLYINATEPVRPEDDSLIVIYPNPSTNNEFYIVMHELPAGEMATVKITDINGREISVSKHNGTKPINHNLAAGIYTVTISSSSHNTSKKLIVK